MYINHCPKDTYFQITELWFNYQEKEDYKKRGIDEGITVYILDNINEEILTICSKLPQTNETVNTIINHQEALQICGIPLKKKPKSIIKK